MHISPDRRASGYNTWYDVTGAFDEALLLKTVDAFMALELPKYGYNYWVSLPLQIP